MKHLLQLFIFLLLSNSISAQTNTCPMGVPPAETCADACIYCNLDGVIGNNGGYFGNGETTCFGQITVNNDAWLGFVAGSNFISMVINSSNCQNGDGLQAAIYDECGAEPIGCNSGGGGMGQQSMTVFSDYFVPGQVYYLMIDGWAGDVCDFSIEVVDGTTIAGPLGTIGSIQGTSQGCPGGYNTYSTAPVANASTYTWTAPVGTKINGLSSPVTINGMAGASVDIFYGNFSGNICVTASNPCSPTTIQACKPLNIAPLPPTILPPMAICYEELPYYWLDGFQTISSPGTYNLSAILVSANGCDSIVKQTIIAKQPIIRNLGLITINPGQCYYSGGDPFCEAGQFTNTLMNYEGCDSTVTFAIQINNNPCSTNVYITSPFQLSCYNPTITLQANSTTPNATYLWSLPNGTTKNTASFSTSLAGAYSVVVTNPNGGCTATASVVVTSIPPPVANAGSDKALSCTVGSVTLNGNGNATSSAFWSGPGITNANKNLIAPAVSMPGMYVLLLTDSLSNCTDTDTVLVTGATAPVANAGQDMILTCSNNFVQLDGAASTATPNIIYNWSGPGITAQNSGFISPSVPLAGTYVLMVTNPDIACTRTDTVLVTAAPNLPIANAGPDRSITCKVDTVTLNGGQSSGLAGYTYQWTPQTVTLPTKRVTKTWLPGTYFLTVTQTATGCKKTDIIIVADGRLYPIANAGVDTSITCTTSNLGINLSSAGSGTNPPKTVTYLWSGPGIDATNATTNSPLIWVPGTYNLIVTEPVSGCTKSDQVVVAAGNGLPVANAGSDQTLPVGGGSVVLNGSGSSTGTNFKYYWTGPGINTTNRTQLNPTVSVAGTYVLRVTNKTTNCVAKDRVLVKNSTNLTNIDVSERAELKEAMTLEIVLSPNPANDVITLFFQEPVTAKVSLIDCFGKTLLETNTEPSNVQTSLPVAHLPAGLYFVKIEIPEAQKVLKFVKE